MGHQSIRTTELYTKISDASKLAAVNALPALSAVPLAHDGLARH